VSSRGQPDLAGPICRISGSPCVIELEDDGIPVLALQLLDEMPDSIHISCGPVRPGRELAGSGPVHHFRQLIDPHGQGLSAPDGEQPLAAGRRAHLDVNDVQRPVGLNRRRRAEVLEIAVGIEQV
jgi:hypothetical protein